MLALKVTPIVGLPQFTGWSQVAESTASVSSRVICVFSVFGKHAGNVGRDISEQISDFYYYDTQQFHEFLQKLIDYASQNNCKLYFAAAVFNKSRSVFAAHGGSIFLRREEKSGKILMSNLEIKLIEGDFQKSDTFILTTKQADSFLNEIQQKFLQGFETDTIITSVVPGLHSQDNSSLSAMVFIKYSEKKQAQQEQVEDETNETQEVSEELTHLPETDLRGNPTKSEPVSASSEEPAAVQGEPKSEHRFEKKSVSLEVSASNRKSAAVVNTFMKVGRTVINKLKSVFSWIVILIVASLKKALSYFRSFIKNIPIVFSHIKNFEVKKLLTLGSKQSVYIESTKKKVTNWKIVMVVLVVLILGSAVGYLFYSRAQELERVSSTLAPISQDFTQAKELATRDPIEAREQLRQLGSRLETLESENQESSALQEIVSLREEVSSFNESISGQEELTELDVFYDLRLVKSDYIASQIDFNTETVLLLDSQMKEIVLLNYDTKEVELRDLSEFDFVTDAVLKDEDVILLADGIREFEARADSEIVELRTEGDSNRSGSLIEAYDRYIYVVNPDKRNIYRYAESDGEYSDPIGWMRGAPGVSYDGIVTVSIDGDLWLSTQSGRIRKFASGTEETFNIRGLESPFNSEIYLFTNEDTENLYVLDPSGNRVVVLSKQGDFIKEFKSVSLGAANGIAVSEEQNIILITAGSLVYQIEINP